MEPLERCLFPLVDVEKTALYNEARGVRSGPACHHTDRHLQSGVRYGLNVLGFGVFFPYAATDGHEKKAGRLS